jgi:pimeloyl-ACP methyl ester carboxylesterase
MPLFQRLFHTVPCLAVAGLTAAASLLATDSARADTPPDLASAFAGAAPGGEDVFLDDVDLHPGVTATLHLRVLGSPSRGCGGEAMVAVHGAATTANSLVDLGAAVLSSPGGERYCWFVSVDLPGHGLSPQPVGALLGDLSLDDYAAAVLGTLDRIGGAGVHTTTLMGHSMGGAVVSLTQQRLVDAGSSLRDAYGVDHVVLLAPGTWPPGVSCALCQNQQFGASLAQFETDGPVLGPVIQLPPAVLLAFAWSQPSGALAPDAPTPAEITANGWSAPESLTAIGELIGAPTPLAPGIFAPQLGTDLDVISFQDDTLILPPESEAMFQYVTGESPDRGWTTIDGPDAVHGMPITDASAMLAALHGRMRFP